MAKATTKSDKNALNLDVGRVGGGCGLWTAGLRDANKINSAQNLCYACPDIMDMVTLGVPEAFSATWYHRHVPAPLLNMEQ